MHFDDARIERIVIQPLGHIRSSEAATVRSALARMYALPVVLAKPDSLPRSAFYAPRQRYRADRLLVFLARDAGTKVIGLTDVDVSTTKGRHADWGVFGLGALGGRSCVVSSFRLRKAARPDQELAKVAVHEIGHTFGLPHCPTPGCVMRDAEGRLATVLAERGAFCPRCAAKLGSRLRRRS